MFDLNNTLSYRFWATSEKFFIIYEIKSSHDQFEHIQVSNSLIRRSEHLSSQHIPELN